MQVEETELAPARPVRVVLNETHVVVALDPGDAWAVGDPVHVPIPTIDFVYDPEDGSSRSGQHLCT